MIEVTAGLFLLFILTVLVTFCTYAIGYITMVIGLVLSKIYRCLWYGRACG